MSSETNPLTIKINESYSLLLNGESSTHIAAEVISLAEKIGGGSDKMNLESGQLCDLLMRRENLTLKALKNGDFEAGAIAIGIDLFVNKLVNQNSWITEDLKLKRQIETYSRGTKPLFAALMADPKLVAYEKSLSESVVQAPLN